LQRRGILTVIEDFIDAELSYMGHPGSDDVKKFAVQDGTLSGQVVQSVVMPAYGSWIIRFRTK